MPRRVFVAVAWALGAVLLPAGPLRADPPFRYPEGKCGTGELKYRNGLPVLTVAGTPEEIGSAVGALALNPGCRVARYPEDILRHFWIGYLYGTVLRAGQGMVEQFPPAHRAEFEA